MAARAPDDRLTEAFRAFEAGDLPRADRLTKDLTDRFGSDARVSILAGQVALKLGRNVEAVQHLRIALAAAPGNVPLRTKLGFALLALEDFDAAFALTAAGSDPVLQRISAFAAHYLGRYADAINHYWVVTHALPGDHESLHNLGLCLLQTGQLDEALQVIARAADGADRPDYVVSLSRALAAGERHAERRDVIERCLPRHVDDPALLLEYAITLAALDDTQGAIDAFERTLEARPDGALAYLEYGMFLEARNRLDEMNVLLDKARAANIEGDEIRFLEAYLLWRRGRQGEAQRRLATVQGGVNPARHKQLEGQIADALGESARAFAAFAEMNAVDADGPAARRARALDFAAEVRRDASAIVPVSRSRSSRDRAAPIFVTGFPRSGTTLLDTFLRNVKGVDVLEEPPMIEAAHAKRAANDGQVSADDYFNDLSRHHGDTGLALVDKHPLHTARIATIHALFADARIVFVERHPCDVILSCFMSRFQTNKAMVCFHSLSTAVELYDATMGLWSRAVATLALNVHRIRYERIIDDAESEVRKLTDFLGFEWSASILENQASAARRQRISTASYAQVGQPLYDRARYRWLRYRHELSPALPTLEPWARAMSYSMDG